MIRLLLYLISLPLLCAAYDEEYLNGGETKLSGLMVKGDASGYICNNTVGLLQQGLVALAKWANKGKPKAASSTTPAPVPEPSVFDTEEDVAELENAIEEYKHDTKEDEATLERLGSDNRAERGLTTVAPKMVDIGEKVTKLNLKNSMDKFLVDHVSGAGPLQELAKASKIKDTSVLALQNLGAKQILQSVQSSASEIKEKLNPSKMLELSRRKYTVQNVERLITSSNAMDEVKEEAGNVVETAKQLGSEAFQKFAKNIEFSDYIQTKLAPLARLTSAKGSMNIVGMLQNIAPDMENLDSIKKQLPEELGGVADSVSSMKGLADDALSKASSSLNNLKDGAIEEGIEDANIVQDTLEKAGLPTVKDEIKIVSELAQQAEYGIGDAAEQAKETLGVRLKQFGMEKYGETFTKLKKAGDLDGGSARKGSKKGSKSGYTGEGRNKGNNNDDDDGEDDDEEETGGNVNKNKHGERSDGSKGENSENDEEEYENMSDEERALMDKKKARKARKKQEAEKATKKEIEDNSAGKDTSKEKIVDLGEDVLEKAAPGSKRIIKKVKKHSKKIRNGGENAADGAADAVEDIFEEAGLPDASRWLRKSRKHIHRGRKGGTEAVEASLDAAEDITEETGMKEAGDIIKKTRKHVTKGMKGGKDTADAVIDAGEDIADMVGPPGSKEFVQKGRKVFENLGKNTEETINGVADMAEHAFKMAGLEHLSRQAKKLRRHFTNAMKAKGVDDVVNVLAGASEEVLQEAGLKEFGLLVSQGKKGFEAAKNRDLKGGLAAAGEMTETVLKQFDLGAAGAGVKKIMGAIGDGNTKDIVKEAGSVLEDTLRQYGMGKYVDKFNKIKDIISKGKKVGIKEATGLLEDTLRDAGMGNYADKINNVANIADKLRSGKEITGDDALGLVDGIDMGEHTGLVKNTVKRVVDSVGKVKKGGTEALNAVGDMVEGTLKDAGLLNFVEKFKKARNVVSDVKKGGKSALNAVSGLATDTLREFGLPTLADTAEKIKGIVEKVMKGGKGVIEDASGLISSALKEAGLENIGDQVEKVQNVITKAMKSGKDGIEAVGGLLEDTLKDMGLGEYSEKVKELTGAISKGSKGGKKAMIETGADFFENQLKMIPGVGPYIEKLHGVKDLVLKGNKDPKAVLDVATGLLGDVLQEAGLGKYVDKFNKIKDAFVKSKDVKKDVLKAAGSVVEDTLRDFGQDKYANALKHVTTAFANGKPSLEEGINALGGVAGELVPGTAGSILQRGIQGGKIIAKLVKDKENGIEDAVGDGSDVIAGILGDAGLGDIGESLKGMTKEARAAFGHIKNLKDGKNIGESVLGLGKNVGNVLSQLGLGEAGDTVNSVIGTLGDSLKAIQNALPNGLSGIKDGKIDLGSLGSGLLTGIGSITKKLGIPDLPLIGNLGNLGDLGKSLTKDNIGKTISNLLNVGDLGKNAGQISKALTAFGLPDIKEMITSAGGGIGGDIMNTLKDLGVMEIGQDIIGNIQGGKGIGDSIKGGLSAAFQNFKNNPKDILKTGKNLLSKIPGIGGQLDSFGDQLLKNFDGIQKVGKSLFGGFKGIVSSLSKASSLKDVAKGITGGLGDIGKDLGGISGIGNMLASSFGDFNGILGNLGQLGDVGKNLANVVGNIGDIGKAIGGFGGIKNIVGDIAELTKGLLSGKPSDKTTSLKSGLSNMDVSGLAKGVADMTKNLGIDLNFGGFDLQDAFSSLKPGAGLKGFTEKIADAGFKFLGKQTNNLFKDVPFAKEVKNLLGGFFEGADLDKNLKGFVSDLGDPAKMGKRLILMAESVTNPENLKDGFLKLARSLPNPAAALKGLGIDKLGSRLLSFAGEDVERMFDSSGTLGDSLVGGIAGMAGEFFNSFKGSLTRANSSRKDALVSPIKEMAQGIGGKMKNAFGGMMKDVKGMRQMTKNIVSMFGGDLDGFLDDLGGMLGDNGALKGVLSSLGNMLGGEQGLNHIMGTIGGLIQGENGGFGGLIDKFKDMMDNGDYAGMLGSVGGMLGGEGSAIGKTLSSAAGLVKGDIRGGIGGMLNGIGSMMGGVNTDVSGLISGLGDAFKGDYASGAQGVLKSIAGLVGGDTKLGGVLNIVGDLANGPNGGLVGNIQNVVENIKSGNFWDSLDSITEIVKSGGEGIGKITEMLGGGSEVKNIMTGIGNIAGNVKDAVKGFKNKDVGAIIDSAGGALNSLGGMFGEDIGKYMKGAGKIAGNIGKMVKNKNSISGWVTGAGDILGDVGDMIGGDAAKYMRGFGNMAGKVGKMINGFQKQGFAGLAEGAGGIVEDIGALIGTDSQIGKILGQSGGIVTDVVKMVSYKDGIGGLVSNVGGIVSKMSNMLGQGSEAARIIGGFGDIAGNVGQMITAFKKGNGLGGLASGIGGIMGNVGGMIGDHSPETARIFNGMGSIVNNLGPMLTEIQKGGSGISMIQSILKGAPGALKGIGEMFDNEEVSKVLEAFGHGTEAVEAVMGIFSNVKMTNGDGGRAPDMKSIISGGAKAAKALLKGANKLLGPMLPPELETILSGVEKNGWVGGLTSGLTALLGKQDGILGELFGEGGKGNKVIEGFATAFNDLGGIEGITKMFQGGMNPGKIMNIGKTALKAVSGLTKDAVGDILPFDGALDGLKGVLGGLGIGEGGGINLMGGLTGGLQSMGVDLGGLTDQLGGFQEAFSGIEGIFGGGGGGSLFGTGGGGMFGGMGGGGGFGGDGVGYTSGTGGVESMLGADKAAAAKQSGGWKQNAKAVAKAAFTAVMDIAGIVMGFCGGIEAYYGQKQQRQAFLGQLDQYRDRIKQVIQYFDTATQTFIDAADEISESLRALAKRVDTHTDKKIIDQFKQYQRLSSTVLELYTEQATDATRQSQFKAACLDPQYSPQYILEELIRILGAPLNYFDLVMEQGYYTDEAFQQALHLSSGNMGVILGAWRACDNILYNNNMPRNVERKLKREYNRKQDEVFEKVKDLNKKREKIYFTDYILNNPQVNLDDAFRGRHPYLSEKYQKFEVDTFNYVLRNKYTYSLEFGGNSLRRLIVEPEFDIVYDPDFVQILTKSLYEQNSWEDEALLQHLLLKTIDHTTTLGPKAAELYREVDSLPGKLDEIANETHREVVRAIQYYIKQNYDFYFDMNATKIDIKDRQEERGVKWFDRDNTTWSAHKMSRAYENNTDMTFNECSNLWGCSERLVNAMQNEENSWGYFSILIGWAKDTWDDATIFANNLKTYIKERQINPNIIKPYIDIMTGMMDATIPIAYNLSTFYYLLNNCTIRTAVPQCSNFDSVIKASEGGDSYASLLPRGDFESIVDIADICTKNARKVLGLYSSYYTKEFCKEYRKFFANEHCLRDLLLEDKYCRTHSLIQLSPLDYYFYRPSNNSVFSCPIRFFSLVLPKLIKYIKGNATFMAKSVAQMENKANGFNSLLKKLITMVPYAVAADRNITKEDINRYNFSSRIEKVKNLTQWIKINVLNNENDENGFLELLKKKRNVVHVVRSRINHVEEYIPDELRNDIKRQIKSGTSISYLLKKFRCTKDLYRLISVYETVLPDGTDNFRYPYFGFGRCFSQQRTKNNKNRQVIFCFYKDYDSCLNRPERPNAKLIKCQLNYDEKYGCNKDVINAATENSKKIWTKNSMLMEVSETRMDKAYNSTEALLNKKNFFGDITQKELDLSRENYYMLGVKACAVDLDEMEYKTDTILVKARQAMIVRPKTATRSQQILGYIIMICVLFFPL